MLTSQICRCWSGSDVTLWWPKDANPTCRTHWHTQAHRCTCAYTCLYAMHTCTNKICHEMSEFGCWRKFSRRAYGKNSVCVCVSVCVHDGVKLHLTSLSNDFVDRNSEVQFMEIFPAASHFKEQKGIQINKYQRSCWTGLLILRVKHRLNRIRGLMKFFSALPCAELHLLRLK